VISGNARLWGALQAKEGLLAKRELTDADGVELAELECVVAEEDGYTAESDAGELLSGLGVPESDHEKCMSELAGGRKLRVLLAQALFGNPDALLLDEPTNNLDIDSIRWLERFLQNYRGVLITISHDRRFLNEICTHIADIDYETIITYTGGYDDMIEAKGQVRGKIEQENSERKKKVEQLQDFVARFAAGTRASQVQSRMKQIEKLRTEDLKRSNIARPFIRFDQKQASGKQTLMIEGIHKSYDGVPVIKPFNSLVVKGEKICVIGKNGVGKSTLVKMIAGQLEPDGGSIKWGHQAAMGYLPQDHHGTIRKDTTAFDWLRDINVKLTNEEISGVLGRMLFSGEERMKPTTTLSGGETVRLLLCKLMLTQDNVLVLDEPTNHLDLESISALAEGLKKFEGTVIVVTHDQELISEVATRIWSLKEGNEVLDYNGPFHEFLEKHSADIAVRRR
jgi:ATPase subunit of ABC transporter with duplicated ATPase domains